MINSKVSAYRKVNNEWLKVSRWDLLKMSEVEYRKFKDDYFPLYLTCSEESSRLTFNSSQKTFRFLPGQIDNRDRQSVGLTISHILAQEVLSELKILNLKLKDKRRKPYQEIEFQIRVQNSIIEHRLFDGEYIADLMIYFSEPFEMATHWNRKVVLEVFTSNEVRGKKISAFEENGIALIEINLGSLILKKKITEITEEEENKHKRHLLNAFKKQIFGDLLVSPVSQETNLNVFIEEKNNEVERCKNKLSEVLSEFKNLQIQYTESISQHSKLKSKLDQLEQQISQLTQENLNLKKDINRLHHLSVVEKIKNIFK